MNAYIALLHYPVYNRAGQIVATSVANMDIHDIARSAKTYGLRRFFIVTPIAEQRELTDKILDHWKTGYGATFNPSRKEAFDLAESTCDLDGAIKAIKEIDHDVKLVVTGAGLKENLITHNALRKDILSSSRNSYLILFGTGSGLSHDIVSLADYCLEPIKGPNEYNHLSVRSAVAITLDRLFGQSAC